MKTKSMSETAQVIALSESKKSTVFIKGNNMEKQHLSIDCYRKLHRSGVLSSFIFTDLAKRDLNGSHQLYVPYLFSYLADDISDINEELKAKGLFDEWLRQERDNIDKC